MKEPGATRGGPSGRKLLATGLQGVGADEAADHGTRAVAAAADPGNAKAVIPAAASATVGGTSQVGGLTGTPPVAW
jgi:hypothetical protein